MQPSITIAETQVKPGTQETIHIPIAKLYSNTAMALPVHVIHIAHLDRLKRIEPAIEEFREEITESPLS